MSDPIQRWWQQFEMQVPRIVALFKSAQKWDLAEWMDEHLGAINPHLMWEFGQAVQCEGHRLVITPESHHELRPLVREILDRAPELPAWEFYGHRLPENLELAELAVEARTGGSLQGVEVSHQRGDFNRVDLYFRMPESIDPSIAFNVAFVGIESLLGEEVLDRWIGVIDVAEAPDQKAPRIPIGELRPAVSRLIEQIQADLPKKPWHEISLDDVQWSSFELHPAEADDYPGQIDLFVAITPAPEKLQNSVSNVLFDSARFSRFGECFCYLKIDGVDGLEHTSFADRGEIDDALNEALRANELGSTLGGGTGLRYNYIELALMDVAAAWQCIGTILSNGRLPKRTWLLFHDAHLAAQWFGLYDDTPSPPQLVDEE